MSNDALKTLFHPFEAGDLLLPAENARTLFLGAEPGLRLPEGFAGTFAVVQGFRPWFNALRAAGHSVSPTPEGQGYDLCLVLAGRYRAQNEAWIADAAQRCRPGGTVLVAGAKDSGIASLRKSVELLVALNGVTPKYHGVAFWFTRPQTGSGVADLAGPGGTLVEGRFQTHPGMFSHERVDPGSRLLAEHLPRDANGIAADFGAGWGLLAATLAETSPGLSRIDLYEADYRSLDAAQENLAPVSAPPLTFHWHDLLAEPVKEKYDLIVMNPPFHQGRASEPDIGKAFIVAASGALKSGGRLFMVANRGLPYGKVLTEKFKDVAELGSDKRFRVFSARR